MTKESKARNPFDEFISVEIAPLLKARGFRRKGRRFTRRACGFWFRRDSGPFSLSCVYATQPVLSNFTVVTTPYLFT